MNSINLDLKNIFFCAIIFFVLSLSDQKENDKKIIYENYEQQLLQF